MQKTINKFKYNIGSSLGRFNKKTKNSSIEYDISFQVNASVIKNYMRDRISLSFMKAQSNTVRDVRNVIGITTQVPLENVIEATVNKIAESYVKTIFQLTKWNNGYDIVDSLFITEVDLPEYVLESVKYINQHKKRRMLEGTDSVLKCNNVIVNTDLDTEQRIQSEEIYYNLASCNRIVKLLELERCVTITDMNELFLPVEDDLNCLTDGWIKESSVCKVHYGEGTNESDIIRALTFRPKLMNTVNLELNTMEIVFELREIDSSLRLSDIDYVDTYTAREKIKESSDKSVYSKVANVTINRREMKKGGKIERVEDKEEGGTENVEQ